MRCFGLILEGGRVKSSEQIFKNASNLQLITLTETLSLQLIGDGQ